MRSAALKAVGAAVLAATLGACAALSGLDALSAGDCPSAGCDATAGQPEGGPGPEGGSQDVTVNGDVAPGDDGGNDATVDAAPDVAAEAGCPAGFLTCDGGCADPSSGASCGGCGNVCGEESPLCAGGDGGYACVGSCPSATPTPCSGSGRCVDTTTDPANCTTCGNACTTTVAHAHATCSASVCGFACDTSYTLCSGACVNVLTDSANCGGCGSSHACATGAICSAGTCISEQADSGAEGGGDGAPPSDAGPCPDGSCPCPDGGCPSSAATGFSCPSFGHCNGATSECSSPGGCFCAADSQCKSGKCVKVTGENDVSCGSACTGSGGRDGFDCELASPGIPAPAGAAYACPLASGYHGTTLGCDPTHTNCYCTADGQCPNGKCVPGTNNNSCSGLGPCTGSGTADYRGCVAIATLPACPIYIGCPASSTCSYPICYCTSDSACASGRCIPSGHNGNCSGCTGTGADDGHGCMPAPSSVPCASAGGTACTTTMIPPPVFSSAKSACLCVADSNCSSGRCVNANSQCTGTCTGSGTADSEDCQTATAVANAWSCSTGNCNDVSSPSGACTAAGVPCWCTSDSQCPAGAQCASWVGCASGACTGTGTGNAMHCVP